MKNRDLIIFSLLTIPVLLIPFILPVFFSTADDNRYIFLLSGSYTGKPCAELVFIGYLLGKLCSWLYTIWDGLEWFSILLYSFYLLSYIIISYYILCWKSKSKFAKYIALISFTILQVYLELTPQSTTLATELSFASFLILLRTNKFNWKQVSGVFLFFVALQLRFSAVFIPYLIASPLLLDNFKWKETLFWKRKVFIFCVLIITMFTNITNHLAYSDIIWNDFKTYNKARGFLADNPIAGNLTSTIKNKKDKLAFDLFYRFRLFDQNILTKEKINNYRKIYLNKKGDVIKSNIRPYLGTYKNIIGWCLTLLLLGLAYLTIKKKKIIPILQLIASSIIFIIVNLYLMSLSFPKERVMLISCITLFFVITFLSMKYVRYQLIMMMMILLSFGGKYMYKSFIIYNSTNTINQEVIEVERMLAFCPQPKIMLPVPTQTIPEAFNTRKSLIGKKGILQGWTHIYPKLDLSYQPFLAYIEKLPILVKKTAIEQIEIIQQLLIMHYGVATKVHIIKESENYLLIKLLTENDSTN